MATKRRFTKRKKYVHRRLFGNRSPGRPTKINRGYGKFNLNRDYIAASRLVWIISFGRIGARRHPEWRPRGERNGRAKTTEIAVRALCSRYDAGGCDLRTLATEYGISGGAASKIAHHVTWAHVAPEGASL